MLQKKIKICRIITRLNVGGPARHVLYLTDRFNNGEFSTTLIRGREDLGEDSMDWLADEMGGMKKTAQFNEQKAALLYDVVDASDGFYRGHAQADCRSRMNVTFRLPNEDLEKAFVTEAQEQRLHSLKGHRSVGGIRASIYNAMPRAGVEALRVGAFFV